MHWQVMRRSFIVSVAILMGVSMFLNVSAVSTVHAEEDAIVAVGDTLQPFMLKRYSGDGEYVALRDYAGTPRKPWSALPRRPVVLSFFANWCQPCRREIPELTEVSKEWGDSVSVFLISVGDKPDQVASFLQEVPTTLPILLDPYKVTSTERYGVSALPTVIVVDGESVVQYVGVGFHEDSIDRLKGVIEGLLSE